MRVFRLSRAKYADKLSGIGASLKGARWNSQGTELIYTSSNPSLAMAEVAVHLSFGMMPEGYCMMEIEIPDSSDILTISPSELPADWDTFPYSSKTARFGDIFVRKGEYLALCVPSAVTTGDFNYLINPAHPAFVHVRVLGMSDFRFDKRLLPYPIP